MKENFRTFYLAAKSAILVLIVTQLSFGQLSIGAWVGVAPSASEISNFQTIQDRKLDFTHIFINWKTTFTYLKLYADAASSNGSTLLVTWEPWEYTTVAIRDSSADAYIIQMAKDIKAYGKEIWLRPLHEANGNWYPWAIGDTTSGKVNTNESYIAAFRHIVTLFRRENVSNVKWVFNLNCDNVGAGTSYDGFYPGDDYVDYTSIDGYNWGTTQSWGSTWKTFPQIFGSAYNALVKINKPIFIPEWASAEQGGNKAKWISDAFETITTSYPKIFAVVWFSMNKETDWRINSSDSTLNAYKTALKKYAPTSTIKKNIVKKQTTSLTLSSPGVCKFTLDKKSVVTVSLCSLQGKLIYTHKSEVLSQGTQRLSFKKPEASGAYILSVKSEDIEMSIPIIQ